MYTKSVPFLPSDQNFYAPEFVQLACRYRSHIQITNNHGEFNAKSIMGMMSLNPRDGRLIITADGPDEEDAVNALVEFLSR